MADPTVERWLSIPGWEDRYEVSDQGRVRSIWYRTKPRESPYPLATPASKVGYPMVVLSRPGERNYQFVHWLVLLAFVGPRPEDMEIRHLNGDRQDNRLVNLRYGTASENAADKLRHGTNAMANKTHCPNGHPYSGENLYEYPGRKRRACRVCAREALRAWRRRRAEAGLPYR